MTFSFFVTTNWAPATGLVDGIVKALKGSPAYG